MLPVTRTALGIGCAGACIALGSVAWAIPCSGTGSCVVARATRHNLSYRSSADSTVRRLPVDEYASGTLWENWGKPAGLSISSPTGAASWGANREDVFAIDSSGNLSHAYWTSPGPASWNSWGKPSGYTFVYSPDAMSWRPQRIDAIVTGQSGSTRKVFRRYWQNGYFSAWQDLGAPPAVTITSRATAASWGAPRFDLFVIASDSNVWHAWSNDGVNIAGWNSWGKPSGVSFLSGVDASAPGFQRIDVFAVSTDGNLWQRSWDNGFYADWANLGKPAAGSLTAFPGAVGAGDLRNFVPVAGPGGTAWERSLDFFGGSWVDRAGSPGASHVDASSW